MVKTMCGFKAMYIWKSNFDFQLPGEVRIYCPSLRHNILCCHINFLASWYRSCSLSVYKSSLTPHCRHIKISILEPSFRLMHFPHYSVIHSSMAWLNLPTTPTLRLCSYNSSTWNNFLPSLQVQMLPILPDSGQMPSLPSGKCLGHPI